jgi:DUF4097 and DUF4098 domain-containing protein YvlB
MEPRNRNILIVVVVVLVIGCCCSLAAGAGAVAWFGARTFDVAPLDVVGSSRQRVEETFAVGDAPTLDVSNFAGSITIQGGEGNTVHVVAVKRIRDQSGMDRVAVNMSQRGGDVVVSTRVSALTKNASVDLDITAPAGSKLLLDTGAGTIDVRGITGPIEVHSGAGQVNLRGGRGPVTVDLGAGQIIYEGALTGENRFQTGAGEIRLRLPAELNMEVDLSTGIGTVGVEFYVDGLVRARKVQGVIGDGSQGSITAGTGAGGVFLEQR